MIAKDYFKNDINIGDTVAFMQIGYRNLMSGKVIAITEKTVLISHKETNTCSTESRQVHSQVIVKR